MSGSPKKQEGFDVPEVKVNDHLGSFSSLPSSDRSSVASISPRINRKMLGLRKIIQWKRKSRDLLAVEDSDDGKDDNSNDQLKKTQKLTDNGTKELETRKKRSRSVDHILTDPTYTANFEGIQQTQGRNNTSAETEARLWSPVRSSVTDEESGDGESGTETFDGADGVETTERLNEQSQRLKKKIDKTKERMKKLQFCMDENLVEYLQSVKINPDPDLSKKTFEKKNCKSNANIGQLQKKLDKYQKAQKDLETRQQREKNFTAKEMLRGVRTSVKEISGGVRDGVKAGFTGAVSKFFNSTENITDAHSFSKSDSECHDTLAEGGEHCVAYDIGKARTPSPKYFVNEEDASSLISGNQSSNVTSDSKYYEPNVDPLETKLKELRENQDTLLETIDKALSNINAIATSLQEERYKTQRLECQFNELRSHWNDFSELHQNEIMGLRQEMERADERIETVDYRIVERVAEIDESFDTFDARISKIENLHHQQGLTVDDYWEQNTQAKAVLTRFLSVVLAILTLVFSLFTLIVHGIAPLTRTRMRLIITATLVAFLALWWHNPEHRLVIHFERFIVAPFHKHLLFLTRKLSRVKEDGEKVTREVIRNVSASRPV